MKSTIININHYLSKLSWLPPLLARIALGDVFIESGWGKLHNLEKVIGFFTSLGIQFPQWQAPMVATIEFVAGLMLVFGLATRLASIPLIGIMFVAIATAKAAEIGSVSDIFGISEFLYVLLLLWLLISGPGLVAVDHLFAKAYRKGKG